jgi:putative membrane protein
MNKLIWILSVVITVAVAVLYWMPKPDFALGFDVHIIPFINALLNGSVAVMLCVGLYFIKQKNQKAHKASMLTAFGLSSLFLVGYVIYHALAKETKFGGEGLIRPVYFFLLITHILLAAGTLPFILISLNHAWTAKFDKHRKIARITWPLWFYVAVTGVVLYFMIAPYYK